MCEQEFICSEVIRPNCGCSFRNTERTYNIKRTHSKRETLFSKPKGHFFISGQPHKSHFTMKAAIFRLQRSSPHHTLTAHVSSLDTSVTDPHTQSYRSFVSRLSVHTLSITSHHACQQWSLQRAQQKEAPGWCRIGRPNKAMATTECASHHVLNTCSV